MSSSAKKWPTSCLRSMFLYIDPMEGPIAEPDITLESTSTISASAYPLCPAIVSTVPSSALLASVVGFPSGSSAHPGRDCFAFLLRRDDVPARDKRSRQINLDMKAFPRRKTRRNRIGPEKRAACPFRRHRRLAARRRKKDHVLIRRPVAVIADGAEMLRIADRRGSDAVFLRHRDQLVEDFHGLDLTESVSGIDRENTAALAVDFQDRFWIDQPFLHAIHVDREARQAMRARASEISGDEGIGEDVHASPARNAGGATRCPQPSARNVSGLNRSMECSVFRRFSPLEGGQGEGRASECAHVRNFQLRTLTNPLLKGRGDKCTQLRYKASSSNNSDARALRPRSAGHWPSARSTQSAHRRTDRWFFRRGGRPTRHGRCARPSCGPYADCLKS